MLLAATMDLIASPFNCIYSARRLQENPVYPATEAFGSGPFQYVQWTKGSFFEGVSTP